MTTLTPYPTNSVKGSHRNFLEEKNSMGARQDG